MPADENQNDKELDELLNLKIDELGELDIIRDEEGASAPVASELESQKPVPDNDGDLQALQNQAFVINFDKQIQQDKDDLPTGVAYAKSITQVKVSDRSEEYKRNIQEEYSMAVKQVEQLYKSLVKGQAISPAQIERIVKHFMKVFSRDAALLLNLSVLQPDYKDYLFNHALRVSLLSINISSANGYSEKQVLDAGQAGLLADVGMMMSPKSIRFKNDKLTPTEEFEVKKAPMMGLYILEKISGLKPSIANASYQHHERENGEGYPNRRKGLLIHNYSKIVSIADIYQAMCSKRSYRNACLPHDAMCHLLKLAKKNSLNRGLVKNFIKSAGIFPIGSFVRLSNGTAGKVISTNQMSIDRPTVSILYDKNNRLLDEGEITQCDLTQASKLRIEKALPKVINNENIMEGF